MKTAKQLLELLTKAFPPFMGAKHAIAVHEEKIVVMLAFGPSEWKHFTLDDEDLERSADDLFEGITALLSNTPALHE